MNKKSRIIPTGIFVVILAVSIYLSYRLLPQVYYLHDEWRALSDVFTGGIFAEINNFSFIELLFGKGRILGSLMNNLMFSVFAYNSLPFITVFYLIHFLNSLFLFVLVKKETKSIIWAGTTALLFATSSRYEQALSWIGAGNQVLISALFSLLSILIFLRRKKSSATLIISLFLAYVGFLFKESSAFTFLVLLYLGTKNMKFTRNRILMLVVICVGVLVILIRFYAINVANTEGFGLTYIVTKGVFNTVFYPLVSLSQYLVPYRFGDRLGFAYLAFNYAFMRHDGNAESIVHFILEDTLSLFFSTSMILVGFFLLKKYVKKYPLIVLAVVWYIATYLPISFRLINRYDSYINSLYTYYGGMPFWILIGGSIEVIYQRIKKYSARTFITLTGGVLLLLVVWKQISITNREVRVGAIRGTDMQLFVSELRKVQQTLPEKPVVFIDSDKNYVREGTKIPFLLGDGYILSVLLYQTGKIPDDILAKRLYEGFGENGYTQQGEKAFGYYSNRNSLIEALQQQMFDVDQVVFWYYKGYAHQLEDRTEAFRKELIAELNGNQYESN